MKILNLDVGSVLDRPLTAQGADRSFLAKPAAEQPLQILDQQGTAFNIKSSIVRIVGTIINFFLAFFQPDC